MKKNAIGAKKLPAKVAKKDAVKKSIEIAYNITDPAKKGPAIMRTIASELRSIHDVVGDQISKVVINCQYSDKASIGMPLVLDDQTSLQTDLDIGEFTVRTNYRNSKYADEDSRDIKAILEELRRLHDELGDQIDEIEDDPEDACSALEDIHAEMETQLDALEEALEEE